MNVWDGGGETNKIEYFKMLKAEWPGVTESPEKLTNQFWDQLAEEVEPDPSSNEVLGKLNQAGVPWGILTNGQSKMQRRKTVKAELKSLAPFILVPSEFDDQKPSPAVFQRAIEETGSLASEEHNRSVCPLHG
jgi:HAD superfamily hydrolase (TIGR01549 family)